MQFLTWNLQISVEFGELCSLCFQVKLPNFGWLLLVICVQWAFKIGGLGGGIDLFLA